ncbi:hypothetical protein HDU97_003667 [Phlyctochytrium planicorne]|nr:hypothetical protein HDU97_003667 [Phlyctochytrium planicorne]
MPSVVDVLKFFTGWAGVRRLVTFLMSAASLLCAGSLFAFGSFSEDLRVRFGFSSKDINIVSALGNTALYTSFLIVGPVWDRFGVRVTMFNTFSQIMSSVMFGLGFLMMWLAFIDRVPSELKTVGAISFYYFLAGFGSCASFMATFAINLVNFPPNYSGVISGVLGIFYALSATLYAQIYAIYYSSDTAGFLLFMTISVFMVNIFATFTMSSAPPPQPKKTRRRVKSDLAPTEKADVSGKSDGAHDPETKDDANAGAGSSSKTLVDGDSESEPQKPGQTSSLPIESSKPVPHTYGDENAFEQPQQPQPMYYGNLFHKHNVPRSSTPLNGFSMSLSRGSNGYGSDDDRANRRGHRRQRSDGTTDFGFWQQQQQQQSEAADRSEEYDSHGTLDTDEEIPVEDDLASVSSYSSDDVEVLDYRARIPPIYCPAPPLTTRRRSPSNMSISSSLRRSGRSRSPSGASTSATSSWRNRSRSKSQGRRKSATGNASIYTFTTATGAGDDAPGAGAISSSPPTGRIGRLSRMGSDGSLSNTPEGGLDLSNGRSDMMGDMVAWVEARVGKGRKSKKGSSKSTKRHWREPRDEEDGGADGGDEKDDEEARTAPADTFSSSSMPRQAPEEISESGEARLPSTSHLDIPAPHDTVTISTSASASPLPTYPTSTPEPVLEDSNAAGATPSAENLTSILVKNDGTAAATLDRPTKRVEIQEAPIVIDGKDKEVREEEVEEEVEAVEAVEKSGRDMTPLQILRSWMFWLFTISYIWQQGITYFNNIGTIVKVLAGPDATAADIAATTGFHVTLLSVSNCIARLTFGAGSDVVVFRLGIDRSSLLLVGEILTAIPLAIVAFSNTLPPALLGFSSVMTGFAFGAASALFPPLTADFFGLKYYGSACALVMVGIPIGIVVSNVIFGSLFDAALASECVGSSCYRLSFVVFLAIQIVPVVLSAVLFFGRSIQFGGWRKREVAAGGAGGEGVGGDGKDVEEGNAEGAGSSDVRRRRRKNSKVENMATV